MKKKLLFSIIIATLISSSPAYSQFGGLKNKAKDAIKKSEPEKKSEPAMKENSTEPKSDTSNTKTESEETKSKVVKKETTAGKFSDIKAGMVNASFEQQAVKLVTDKATRENWAEKYSKAKIISTDWEIEKDEYTNKIICRKIYMKLYGVWPNGKCKVVEFGFKQDYMGGDKYTNSLIYNSIGDMKTIDCE